MAERYIELPSKREGDLRRDDPHVVGQHGGSMSQYGERMLTRKERMLKLIEEVTGFRHDRRKLGFVSL